MYGDANAIFKTSEFGTVPNVAGFEQVEHLKARCETEHEWHPYLQSHRDSTREGWSWQQGLDEPNPPLISDHVRLPGFDAYTSETRTA